MAGGIEVTEYWRLRFKELIPSVLVAGRNHCGREDFFRGMKQGNY